MLKNTFFNNLSHAFGFHKMFEKRLESKMLREPLPKHIGIILDGNRRWAKYNFFGPDLGHNRGADKAEELLNWIHDIGIKITTVYVLSNENLSRKDDELGNIYNLLYAKLVNLRDDSRIHKRQMKIKAIGNIELLPKNLRQILLILEEETSTYNSMFLNIAVAYGRSTRTFGSHKKNSKKN